jgi:hypothetical protein
MLAVSVAVVLLFLAVTEALVLQTGARPCLHEVLARGTASMSGLVNGASCDDFYSRKLKNRDADLIREEGFLWKAVQDDAVARGVSPDDYLIGIKSSRATYFKEEKLCPRPELDAAMRSILTSTRGAFSLFIGGYSVGKSFLIRNICRDLNAQGGCLVAVIDGRVTGPDLTPSIIGISSRNASKAEKLLFNEFIPRAQEFFEQLGPQVAVGPISVNTNARELIGLFKRAEATPAQVRDAHAPYRACQTRVPSAPPATLPPPSQLSLTGPTLSDGANSDAPQAMTLFVQSAQAAGLTPSLIIDEANLVFSPEVLDAQVIAERNRAVLNLLTSMSKQGQQLNVILVTSEERYPYKLRDDLKFKLSNVDGAVIHAGEVPPKAMRELLVNEWGVGSHLAAGLLAVNGGHVRQASNILEDLARTRDGFRADQCPQKGLLAGIYNCSNEGEKKHSGMKKLMRQLGEDGFVTPALLNRGQRLNQCHWLHLVASSWFPACPCLTATEPSL